MPNDEPKSPAGTPADRSAAAKEKSRQQSRPVSGRQAAKSTTSNQPGKAQKPRGTGQGASSTRPANGKSPRTKPPTAKAGGPSAGATTAGASRAGAGQRPPRQGRPAAAKSRRSTTSLLTWGAVALVLVIVIALVAIKLTQSNTPSAVDSNFVQVNSSVAHDVTSIPTSVYNSVGISSSATSVNPPTAVHGQPPLTFGGKPGAYYFGAEYCPYCAAERWAIIASLSRFGKWSNLGAMESSTSDVFPGTQTFTFLKAGFSSPYLALKTQEYESNVPLANGQGYTLLQKFVGNEEHLVTTYDTPKYVPGTTAGSFPFFDIGNKFLVSGASYSPSVLGGLSRDQIASGLSDPTNPVTQAIVATSNYLSAGTCAVTGQQPASVCTSKGVTEAAKALKIHS